MAPFGLFSLYQTDMHSDAVTIREALGTFLRHPWIAEAMIADLEAAAVAAQAARHRQARQRAERSQGEPFIAPVLPAFRVANEAGLHKGRGRTPTVVLFIAGIMGLGMGRKWSNVLSNIYFRDFMTTHSYDIPNRTTISRNIRNIRPETFRRIFIQVVEDTVDMLKNEGLSQHELDMIFMDSTASASASAPVCDEQTLIKLIAKAQRLINKMIVMNKAGDLRDIAPPQAAQVELAQAATEVSMAASQAGRKRKTKSIQNKYEKAKAKAQEGFLEQCNQALLTLDGIEEVIGDRLTALHRHDGDPLRELLNEAEEITMAAYEVADVLADIYRLGPQSMRGEKRVLSISDPDASFIVKGGRQTTFGYRPQLATSPHGLVLGFTLPHGNTPDSAAFGELLRQVHATLGGIDKLSVDDGYSSAANRQLALDLGVTVPSFKGAKGKKITPAEDYDSEPFRRARQRRACGESPISSLKRVAKFGQMTTFSHSAVYREMSLKLMAHNFRRRQTVIADGLKRLAKEASHAHA
jgi:hypothetical protein